MALGEFEKDKPHNYTLSSTWLYANLSTRRLTIS